MAERQDFGGLSDNDLVTLAIDLRRELQRRGLEAEAETWLAALTDADSTRIAREAAEAETRRLLAEEARKTARAAAERVRQEAEGKKREEERKKAEEATASRLKREAALRGLAEEARSLFGSDVAEFTVQVWTGGPGRAGTRDKRVYVGGGYENNWVEYYYEGNARTKPGTLVGKDCVIGGLARHRGIGEEDARALIRDYCDRVAKGWTRLLLEVTEGNAPRDPRCQVTRYYLRDQQGRRGNNYKASGGWGPQGNAIQYPSREEAEAAASREEAASVEVVEVKMWIDFPDNDDDDAKTT